MQHKFLIDRREASSHLEFLLQFLMRFSPSVNESIKNECFVCMIPDLNISN